MSETFNCCVIMLVTVIMCTSVNGQSARNEPKDKQMITIRAQDIPQTVQIVGMLGQPLGSLLTVCGQWTRPVIRPGIRLKDQTLVFQVSRVNGKKLNENVALHGLQVESIVPDYKGIKVPPGDSWDWKFDWQGCELSPTYTDGEIWEMMGVETGCFDFYSAEVWREIDVNGPPFGQIPSFMKGFNTRFQYISIRRERKTEQGNKASYSVTAR